MVAARETRSALLDEQRARLRSENRARLERTARRELLEERQMVRQLLERPEAEQVAAAMCLEFGESSLAPRSAARTDAERSPTISRASPGASPEL